eukprot:scaffold313876_cov45-Prasinocladus_malaysianus.AAC.1
MALSDSMAVVQQACRTLTTLASSSEAMADKLIGSDVLQAMLDLMNTEGNPSVQAASLKVMSSIAFSCEKTAKKLMSEDLLSALTGDECPRHLISFVDSMCPDKYTTLVGDS